jgi:hypothetical protein
MMATNKSYGECLLRQWRTGSVVAFQVVPESKKMQLRSSILGLKAVVAAGQ